MADDADFEAIAREARSRFEERIKQKGKNAEGLGWDSRESMEVRFEAARDLYDFTDSKILDIGCGFGDLLGYLRQQGEPPAEYVGVDISDTIIEEGRNRFPEARFERRNIFVEPYEHEQFDIAVEFGVLNYSLNRISNAEYVRRYIEHAYSCSDAVLVNCLSDYREGDWGYEDFVHYYSPEKVFGYAQELTRDVVLKHDLEPIPQKEFHLLMGA